jgi:hypothetical protein
LSTLLSTVWHDFAVGSPALALMVCNTASTRPVVISGSRTYPIAGSA